MSVSSGEVNGWAQQTLESPEVIEITLKLGVMVRADHVQAQVEVRDPSTGLLLAMVSWPHADMSSAAYAFEVAIGEVYKILYDLTGPFPA